MNREQLLAHHKEMCDKALSIMVNKNHDYTGDRGDSPFANFERSEKMGLSTTEVGILIRMVDKISRLSTFANTGKLVVSNESYEDAVLDIINYSILLSGVIRSKQSQNKDLKQS
jgi:hypothetical protein